MFKNIPNTILQRMKYLEELDRKDRLDDTPRLQRLRQIPPETGRFLAILASMAPEGEFIEIGTSAGYSTLWLVLVARESGRKIVTFETMKEKVKIAKEAFRFAKVENDVELIEGDALKYLDNYKKISFCFLDAEKESYGDFYEKIISNLVTGGLLVADNVISHRETLQSFVDNAENDPRVDSLVVPIGKGELACRKL
jgi:caffeoyl-CoA O-methyltransferase